jgi:tRNA(Ile)-lysidine synthase
MRTRFEQSVLEAIREAGMLRAGDRVGVAVSGGADSVALLRLLETLRSELGVTLAVAHLNHSLRGEESDADAEFVRELAQAAGHEFLVSKVDVGAEAARNGWNVEDAARRLRYGFFHRLVEEKRVTRIAVAHTADDQAETVLARVIRGTGLTGLGGIYPEMGVVVRPLLEVRRRELREYLQLKGQAWREDSSNQDLRRTRARIRSQILPQLESEFSPQIVGRLNELARLAREEEVFWSALVRERFADCVKGRGEGFEVRIDELFAGGSLEQNARTDQATEKAGLHERWRPLTERLIRRLYQEAQGEPRELSAQNVLQVIRLATESESGRRTELPGGVVVEREFGTLIFSVNRATRGNARAATADSASSRANRTETRAGANAFRYELTLQATGTTSVSVPELRRCFRLKVIDWPLAESETKSSSDAIDADLLDAPLILRNWQPGDAYRPHGRREARKLKEMFRTVRAPSRERSRWPVLESGGRVIWTRGMPPADEICASAKTRAGVVIEEENL